MSISLKDSINKEITFYIKKVENDSYKLKLLRSNNFNCLTFIYDNEEDNNLYKKQIALKRRAIANTLMLYAHHYKYNKKCFSFTGEDSSFDKQNSIGRLFKSFFEEDDNDERVTKKYKIITSSYNRLLVFLKRYIVSLAKKKDFALDYSLLAYLFYNIEKDESDGLNKFRNEVYDSIKLIVSRKNKETASTSEK